MDGLTRLGLDRLFVECDVRLSGNQSKSKFQLDTMTGGMTA